MKSFETRTRRVIVGRLERDEDLVPALYEVASRHDVRFAEIRALGALTQLQVTEWDDEKKAYRPPLAREGLAEVLMLYGNLSMKGGLPFWHLHVSAGYEEAGRTRIIAGHVVEGRVYALEFVITELEAESPERVFDPGTGLFLWR